jgi:hypothetical protein
MSDDKTRETLPDGVEVTENMGEWFVRVVINGKAHVSTFEVEAYARSFADGQRIRVGLSRFVEPALARSPNARFSREPKADRPEKHDRVGEK